MCMCVFPAEGRKEGEGRVQEDEEKKEVRKGRVSCVCFSGQEEGRREGEDGGKEGWRKSRRGEGGRKMREGSVSLLF